MKSIVRHIDIAQPIWNGGKDTLVGLDTNELPERDIDLGTPTTISFKILYRRKSDGLLSFPGTYEVLVEKARKYKTWRVKGRMLNIVPLKECMLNILPEEAEKNRIRTREEREQERHLKDIFNEK